MSGNSCARTGCPTECSDASTTSSAIAAMPGTHSSTNPGRSCLSQDAHGLASVNQSEDWYQSLPQRQRERPEKGANRSCECEQRCGHGHDQFVLDHVRSEQMLAQPVQWRQQARCKR